MFVSALLNIGYGDAKYIDELVGAFDDNEFIDTIREDLENVSFKDMDANIILFSIFNRINETVFNGVKKYIEDTVRPCIGATKCVKENVRLKKETLINLCKNRIETFEPFINCLDSHFNNELDQIDIKRKNFDEIIDDLSLLLCANYENDFYDKQQKVS